MTLPNQRSEGSIPGQHQMLSGNIQYIMVEVLYEIVDISQNYSFEFSYFSFLLLFFTQNERNRKKTQNKTEKNLHTQL